MGSSTPRESPEVPFSRSGDQEATDSLDPYDGINRGSNSLIAAAYNTTAIIGIGVLGLPHAMVFLTWRGGPLVLALAFFITSFTMMQLVELHDFELGKKKKRYGTYYELGERAIGKTLTNWLIWPMQMVVEVSLDVLYTVAAGEAMNRVNISLDRPCVHMFAWFAVFSATQIVLSSVVRNFESKTLKWVVIIAVIMSICYTTISWITIVSIYGGSQPAPTPKPSHGLPDHIPADYPGPSQPPLPLDTTKLVLQAFNAIGVVAFAYATHNVVLEIQNGIPTTASRSARKAMKEAVRITYVLVALCYFPMAFGVYQVLGNTTSTDVLSFIFRIQSDKEDHDVVKGLSIATNLMLVFHLTGSYQIFALPVFKQMEDKFTRSPTLLLRIVYIACTMILAMVLPYFSPLLGFFGGLAIAPTTFILPSVMWLCIKNQELTGSPEPKRVVEVFQLLFKGDLRKTKGGYTFYFDWACIILGLLLTIVAVVGGLGVLIEEWKNSNNNKLWTSCWRNSSSYGSTCNIVPLHC